ncbi:GTP 3',8-cyclase MoaA [Parvicella tangerina]|uniref:GTP 3',8-cyclase n=1 Tax=Parvicella tangerina TaxID=2829795 RepID=A0A916JKH1_9FLAO|nr:GTP 3',8-cyclase MoaA [Parvicella tangerina]CAG5078425.1 GTP 3',8-cyclase 1 [Parvicella tangerina]
MLKDNHGREHSYLRISLTEKCNLRCTYCMPEDGVDLRPSREYMTVKEVLNLARQFVELGVNKIRLTGGEPLVFKGFSEVLIGLAELPVELSITTNGIQLHKYFDELQRANVSKINISIDTLEEEKFNVLTRRKGFSKVWQSIREAIKRGFHVKLNMVVMKGFNDNEVVDFVALTNDLPIEVRFIEFMPFDGNQWNWDKVVPEAQLMNVIEQHFGQSSLQTLPLEKNYIARTFSLPDAKGCFGFISTMTHSFCGGCNRIRLTADGHIKNCLFTDDEIDLLTPLREGKSVVHLIEQSIKNKHPRNGGIDFENPASIHAHRSMISIGG